MGDRYLITVKCECGFEEKEVYYAPTCGFSAWKCRKCNRVVDLEEYTGISYEEASNKDLIQNIANAFIKNEKKDD